jgi:hypothetical protein
MRFVIAEWEEYAVYIIISVGIFFFSSPLYIPWIIGIFGTRVIGFFIWFAPYLVLIILLVKLRPIKVFKDRKMNEEMEERRKIDEAILDILLRMKEEPYLEFGQY